MTEPRRRRRRGPHPVGVAGLALATFVGVAVLLAWQMSAGRDPALGAGAGTASAQPTAVVRRLVRRTIVERRVQKVVVILPPRAPLAATQGASTGSGVPLSQASAGAPAAAAPSGSAPQSSAAAPTAAAPAPAASAPAAAPAAAAPAAPAPAPAPAPALVTTSQS